MYDELEKPLRELARTEPLLERARAMTDSPGPTSPNGIKLVRVAVDNVSDTATFDVHFYNLNYLASIVARYAANHTRAKDIFPISGGTRLRAGSAAGQVKVDSSVAPATPTISMPNAAKPVLQLIVKPIGDYSTYTLSLISTGLPAGTKIDALFSEISFKFRPGCFNNNCAPEWESPLPPFEEPVIDYLAKDYNSFRQTMITAMSTRVPEWEPTSEADLDMVLAELFSVLADELSDYQDRVMNEAYLASARKRVSLARQSRLMDYHIHQGSQASTWLSFEIEHHAPGQKLFQITENLLVWAGESEPPAFEKPVESSVVLLSKHKDPQTIHQYLNNIGLYTWSDTITTLKSGTTRADLKLYNKLYLGDTSPPAATTSQASANTVRDLIRTKKVRSLLIQEHLNPNTGLPAGRNPSKRQLLNLIPEKAESLQDNINGEWFVRVHWAKKDALKFDYCFTVDCPADNPGTAVGKVDNVSLFHGNLVQVFHGRELTTIFKDESVDLDFTNPDAPLQFHYERNPFGEPGRWGVICRLPEVPLEYKQTTPGGDMPPYSTLNLSVTPSGGVSDEWNEMPNLIHSDDSSENGDHFVVETDENRRSIIRFGNGRNGRELPEGAEVECTYQYGLPLDGNVGADRIIRFDKTTVIGNPPAPAIQFRSCWNPFDVTNGVDREPVHEIIRRVPEAYRYHQLRAVTLADYIARAEKIEGVSRVAARYAWAGSWRTVRVTIDPEGTTELSYELRKQVAADLNAVRLIGEDLEIRAPALVPLEINVVVCVTPGFWWEDIKFVLEQEFSAGWTPDGRMGFFHTDLWTFGQPLYASQIIGRALQVKGVEHAVEQKTGSPPGDPTISVSIKRWNSPFAPAESLTQLAHNEIIMVMNDPNHQEKGSIKFSEGKRK